MNGHDIVVVGASTGGVEALPQLVGGLPPDFPGSIFIVLHLPVSCESYLPQIISRAHGVRAVHPRDKQPVERGVAYVAPPDHHLWLEDSRVRVTHGPRVNRHRPAIDPLFESAAHRYRQRVVGVILTGSLDDGTAGLSAIKQCGGVAVVQDPKDALVPAMPENALRYVKADHVLPLAEISHVLRQLAVTSFKKKAIKCPENRLIMDRCTERPDVMKKKFGPPTSIICPDCGGPLWEMRQGKVKRYRCLTGHLFSHETLLDGEKEDLEKALWTATKTLEERAGLLRKMAVEAAESRNLSTVRHLDERAKELEKQAETVRRVAKKVDPT